MSLIVLYILKSSGLGQAQKCGGIKPVYGIPPSDNWISNCNTEINKQYVYVVIIYMNVCDLLSMS
jgi:hypothetical protein